MIHKEIKNLNAQKRFRMMYYPATENLFIG